MLKMWQGYERHDVFSLSVSVLYNDTAISQLDEAVNDMAIPCSSFGIIDIRTDSIMS